MSFRIFRISASGDEGAEQDLNKFLNSTRIVNVDRQLIVDAGQSYWTFCVEFLGQSNSSSNENKQSKRNRIDYREVLSADEFAVFAKLRDLRKELATAESIPLYAVFTNEQLAQMVQQQVSTREQLAALDNVGDGKVSKYGEKFLSILCADAAGSRSVQATCFHKS